MDTPIQKRAESRLTVYAGIHDGYEGSVPVSQSIKFYNKVISDFGASKDQIISDDEILSLVTMRTFPIESGKMIGYMNIIFERNYENITLVIFEGTHEMLPDVALEFLTDE